MNAQDRSGVIARRCPFVAARRLVWLLILSAGLLGTNAYARRAEEPDARAFTAVDSLIACHRMGAADSLLGAPPADASPRQFADTLAALSWIVRRCEIAPYTAAVGTVDSSTTRRTISLAERVRPGGAGSPEEALRLQIAAARGKLTLGDFRGAAASALDILIESSARRPIPYRVTYDAWIIRARALTYLGAADSGRAAADSARHVARAPWASALDRAWADGWLAWVNQRLISPTTACTFFGTALPVLDAATPELDRDLLGLHLSLGAALVGAGDARASVNEYRKMLTVLERNNATENFLCALILEQLGARERRLGEFVAARRDGERSIELMKRLVGTNSEDYGFASSILGAALRELGDLSGAEQATRVSLDVMAARVGPFGGRVPETYNNMAIIYRRMGRLDSALACIERSRAAYLARRNPRDQEQYNTLATMANVLGDVGRYEESAAFADSAAIGMIALYGPDHHYVPSILLVQATAERACGRDSSALALLDSVVVRRLRKYGPVHPDVQDALCERSLAQAIAGRPAPSMRDALEALSLQREIRQALLRGLDERTALAVICRPKWTAMDVALTLAERTPLDQGDLARLYDEIVRQRSLLFDELLARRRDSAGDPAMAAQRARLAVVRAEIANVLLSGGDRTRAVLDSLSRLEEGLELGIGTATRPAIRLATRLDSAGLDQVRAALPPRSAMVGVARYGTFTMAQKASRWAPHTRPAYAAFVTRQGRTDTQYLNLGEAAIIDSLAGSWLSSNGRPGQRESEAKLRAKGRALRQHAFDKILNAVRGADRVYMVLDGPLALVDPSTLPDDSGGYLLEHPQRLLRLTSERELLETGPSSRGGLLALGGPDFNGHASDDGKSGSSVHDAAERFTSCEELKLRRFGALPGSAAEAEAVSRRWQVWAHGDTNRSALLLLGAAAREGSLRAACRGRLALHLATHGFALHDDCDAWSPEAAAIFRTLFRTGLALAGANTHSANLDPGDDGLLTAGEVSALDLTGVSWVSLSACESGLGDAVTGEGVQGLVRAFQVAGARQVVMSLWPVADEDAARWNDAFYARRLEQSLSVSEAAREASLELLRERRAEHQPTPPATWACFTVAGKDE